MSKNFICTGGDVSGQWAPSHSSGKRQQRWRRLARFGLRRGLVIGLGAIAVVVVILIVWAGTTVLTGQRLLTGEQFVTIVATVVGGLVVYFTLVLDGFARIRLELSAKKKKLEITAGRWSKRARADKDPGGSDE